MIFYTGDIPVEGLLSKGPLKTMNYDEQGFLWAGCIDAPWAMPAGSQRNATLYDGRVIVVKYDPRPD